MTQDSLFHAGNTVGDAVQAPYSAGEWNDFFWWFLTGRTSNADDANVRFTNGVVPNYANTLVPSLPLGATGGVVRINTGAAIVGGVLYINDGTVDIAVATPVSGINYYMFALKKDVTAQTVRAVALGPEAAMWPNVAGFSWDSSSETEYIPIYGITVNTGGTITLQNDMRRYLYASDYRAVVMTKRQGGDPTIIPENGDVAYDVEDNGSIIFGHLDNIQLGSAGTDIMFSLISYYVATCTNKGVIFLATARGADADYSLMLASRLSFGVYIPVLYVKDMVTASAHSMALDFIMITVADEAYGVKGAYQIDAFNSYPYEGE